MTMKNMDKLATQKAEVVAKIQQAMTDGNTEDFQAAFTAYTDILQEAVMAEAKGLIQAADNNILAGRGVRPLTSEETKYYQKLVEVMKSPNLQQAISGFDEVLPKTVIDAVFEDITEAHPLLGAIQFENAGALIEWIYSTSDGRFLATWGPLCSTITKQLAAQFQKLSLSQTKLSAFLPLCKAMLDLGPAWLDRYVRTILYEAIANGLENGIINGRGVAEGAADAADRIYEPIGMIKDLTNFDLITGYADKVPTVVTNFSPATYGALAAQLAVGPNLLNRTVTELLLVVNPVDYLNRVMPATVYLTPGGTYARDVFPLPTKVVQSAYMTPGKAALGLGKRYLMAMGAGTNGGRIEYSDEYKFLEDERYYLIKLYGTGRPKDNTSFLYLDVSNLQPLVPDVNVNNWPPVTPVDVVTDPLNVNQVFDARLASLKVGALVLSPAFNKSIMYYTAATTDATNKITAAPMDGEATIEILHGVTPVANGDSATWEAGENTVTITVTSGTETETYTVVVTKS